MNPQHSQSSDRPTTPRAKIVFFIWSILPRLVLLVMLITIVVLFMAIGKKKDSIAADKMNSAGKKRPPVNCVIHEVQPTIIQDKTNLPGSIEPWTTLELTARVTGTISDVLVEEGDEVQKNQILARIEEDDYKIALRRAKAAYSLARADYRREKAVYDKGVTPKAQLDARETAMLTAKADLDDARLQLSRCTIKAPIDGIIRRLDAETGMLLSTADPVAQILKIDRVKAVVGIPESDVPAVRGLHQVDITIQALDNRIITGQTHFLAPAPTTTARLYTLELAVDNPSREILPGMFFRADVVKKTVDNALAIPFYSVISRNNEHFVFVENDGTAQKKNVRLGIMENWMVEIVDGLKAGDRLIIEGHRDIEDGQNIKVVKTITNIDEYTL